MLLVTWVELEDDERGEGSSERFSAGCCTMLAFDIICFIHKFKNSGVASCVFSTRSQFSYTCLRFQVLYRVTGTVRIQYCGAV